MHNTTGSPSSDNAHAVGIIISPSALNPELQHGAPAQLGRPIPDGVGSGNGLLLADWGNDDRAAALRLWLRQKIVTA